MALPLRSILVAAALGETVLVVPGSPATAAGGSCQGRPATLVGTPGGTVTGTEGDEVIVTNGATDVSAKAGDDLVCTTRTAPGPAGIRVFADEGDDVVDSRDDVDPDAIVVVTDGSGRDTVIGGPGPTAVTLTDDRRSDLVVTGAGDDRVLFTSVGRPTAAGSEDRVDLGDGDDAAVLWGPGKNATTLSGGPGRDRLDGLLEAGRGGWTVNARTGRIRDARRATAIRFAGFEEFSVAVDGQVSGWRFVGGSESETVTADRGRLGEVRLGKGDDVLELGAFTQPDTSTVSGGRGHDVVEFHGNSADAVSLDLGAGRLAAPRVLWARLRSFEDARVEGGFVRIIGDDSANQLTAVACARPRSVAARATTSSS